MFAATLPILLRRRFPLTVVFAVMIAIPFYDLVGNGPNQPIWYGWLIAVYTVAYASPPSYRMVVIVVTAVGTLVSSGRWTRTCGGWRPGWRPTPWAGWRP
ncbi:DUF7134 domain-containing protein [Nonomuraea sp. 10N515B]|uniref:DUF7134 domain-containing protein n=1 Tax=Nonomuraea sp. 10N515B TaxID=3457422 RepID=UPI003FCCAE4D